MKTHPHVNVYDLSRAYGGPEEGGWFYDVRTPVASFPARGPLKGDKARAMLNKVRASYGMETSQSRAYQNRVNSASCSCVKKYRRGSAQYADRFYSEFRHTGGGGLLVCLEYGPAKESPVPVWS